MCTAFCVRHFVLWASNTGGCQTNIPVVVRTFFRGVERGESPPDLAGRKWERLPGERGCQQSVARRRTMQKRTGDRLLLLCCRCCCCCSFYRCGYCGIVDSSCRHRVANNHVTALKGARVLSPTVCASSAQSPATKVQQESNVSTCRQQK